MQIDLNNDERYFLGDLLNDFHKNSDNINIITNSDKIRDISLSEQIFDKLRLCCFMEAK